MCRLYYFVLENQMPPRLAVPNPNKRSEHGPILASSLEVETYKF